MPRYSYIAKTLEGEAKTGVLEAKNEHELARILRQEGSILIKTDFEEEKKSPFKFWYLTLPFFKKVSLIEKIMFARNLRLMIRAGVSLPRALNILADQAKSKKFRASLLEIKEQILEGKAFSESLAKFPNIFSELFTSVVKVGEETGTLEEVLRILTQQMEKEQEVRSKIKGAMVYPAVIIFALISIGILMLIIVVPRLAAVFQELEIELPLTTKLVIFLGSFLAKFWYTLPLAILFFIILIRFSLKTKIGKKVFDTISLKLPIAGKIIKKAYAARTVRTLSALISAGVPIVRVLEITADVLGNLYYKNAILEAANRVKKGAKLGKVFSQYEDIYPSLVTQMIEVGEETGETSEILEKLAEFFEEEVTNVTKNLSSIIEPVLMLIIGAAVGFFAVSMIQPIYSMIEAIK